LDIVVFGRACTNCIDDITSPPCTLPRIARRACGAHAHEHYPDRLDGEWMKHLLTHYDKKKEKRKIGYRPIHYYTLDEDECKTVPPVMRV